MEKKSFISKYYNIIINILIIMFIIIMLVAINLMKSSSKIITDVNMQSLSYIQTINSSMKNIDNNVLESITILLTDEDADVSEYIEKIENNQEECTTTLENYSKLSITTIERNRFEQFRVKYLTYEKDVTSLVEYIENKQAVDAASVYEQELIPVKNCISEILDALTYLTEVSADTRIGNNTASANLAVTITLGFGVIILIIINLIKFKIDKDAEMLESTNKNLDKTKNSLTTAVFNDVLTGALSRISFINDFSDGKEELHNSEVAYMTMFNINNFDEVNISYGSNAGDIILEETANRISEILKGDKIYRVGSDEFIVYSKRTNSTMDYNKLINDINTLRFQLTKPYDIETGKVTVSYSTSMVKKAGPATLTSRTLEYLKDAMNRGRIQNPAEISYVDMDMQSLL